jgi:hypothetical protein
LTYGKKKEKMITQSLEGGDIIIMGISFHCESLDSFLSITGESIR